MDGWRGRIAHLCVCSGGASEIAVLTDQAAGAGSGHPRKWKETDTGLPCHAQDFEFSFRKQSAFEKVRERKKISRG